MHAQTKFFRSHAEGFFFLPWRERVKKFLLSQGSSGIMCEGPNRADI